MYIPNVDQASEAEWRRLVQEVGFGTLIAVGRDREFPIAIPVHYAWREPEILVHFHVQNPVWDALAEQPAAMLQVLGPHAYIPGQWNAPDGRAPEHGIPTSYFAVVQLQGSVSLVDDPDGLAALLQEQVDAMQPEGGLEPVTSGAPYGQFLGAIRGLRLQVHDVVAKRKFGSNRAHDHRERIAHALDQRGSGRDRDVAAWIRDTPSSGDLGR